MLKAILLALSLAVSSVTPAPNVNPAMDRQHQAAHHINFKTIVDGDSCSATAVGPHTLLTAGHCLMASNEITIDGQEAHIKNLVFDDADHMLVVTDATFAEWLRIDQTALDVIQPGAVVHMWGNPGRSTDVPRTGVFLKWEGEDDEKLAVFELAIFGGDSGSGLLDDNGSIIAVVSLGNQSANGAVFPMQFTPEQLGQIR